MTENSIAGKDFQIDFMAENFKSLILMRISDCWVSEWIQTIEFSSIQIENNFKSFSWIESLENRYFDLDDFGQDFSVSVQIFKFDHVLTKTSKTCLIIFGPVSKAFEPWI